ncbi:polyprenyl diphosphate synthase [Thermoproteota archaeon]
MTDRPLHVGIVLDGNRRWAKDRDLEPWKGHAAGADALRKLLKELDKLGVSELTVYGFSIQNFKRVAKEREELFNVMRLYFEEMKDDPSIVENQVKINFIGRLELLPEDLQELIGYIANNTAHYERYKLNFALAYGGRSEIVDAVKKIVKKQLNPDDIDEETVKNNLYMEGEPDLIIRTGGDRRTSNFLPWQSTYSEWFFLDKPWPDFTKQDIIQCVKEFNDRERRFGI